MSPDERSSTNLDTFIAPHTVIAGRRLASFSAGRLQLCRALQLGIITGTAAQLDQSALERELLAVYYIHTATVDEAKTAVAMGPENFFTKIVEPLSFEFPARELSRIMDFIDLEFRGVEAAQVEVLPKPGPGGEAAPPNS